ncbi:hypothetical protein JDV02_008836 [Purpureocillium takamizusanense]|uniref:SnoaL-like domain-containing protein n=1 Tax=Purpureocillium takamizusanense TaxID=2060973 RepID=A0A9Q8QQM8_9HYPO|nr:uncharacterized protein JDV02_008836 [Purpureocillium takamizusanense]UNI22994.1 hypothetical protein JDV02_008836 [Purpureocillium takamizusanense]
MAQKSATEKFVTEWEISSLLTRERYYRDTAQWQKLRDSFHPDPSRTSIKITWFNGNIDGFVAGSQKMAAQGTHSCHTICPIEIHVNGDKAVSESTGSIMARFRHHGVDYDCTSYARFVSRLERVDGEWKMLTLEALYERDTIRPAFPGTSTEAFDVGGGRASYKGLGWLLSQNGFSVDQDLPGADMPESVDVLMDSHRQWLQQ